MEIRIVPYDDNLWTNEEERTTYLDDKSKYGAMPWKKDFNTWAAAYVTGHKYKVHWGQAGIDWESVQLRVSEKWEPTDKAIWMVHNHTDVRSNITVTDSDLGVTYPNNSISGTDLTQPSTFTTG